MSVNIECPECGSLNTVKSGFVINRSGRHQRFKCNDCARNFMERD